MNSKPVIHLIAAARPNFMKIAPLYHVLSRANWCEPEIVHTGQHYDVNMSDVFFRDLGLPTPHHHLNVGSGTHAEQTGGVMMAYEKLCQTSKPDVIVVVGDVNSTAACAMVGAKLWIPVVHLEAGLRSRDRRMPEEINRLVTDAIADVLWTPSPDADENLEAEGVPADKIDRIGNIMIDSFEMLKDRIASSDAALRLGLDDKFALVTLHRPSNVDAASDLAPLIDALVKVSTSIQVVFVAHPRTIASLRKFGLDRIFDSADKLRLVDPMPYIDFMGLVTKSILVITDSGGLQEETTYLGMPCLTLRENTERPITVSQGTNRLVACDELEGRVRQVVTGDWPKGKVPPLWDGRAAERAEQSLKRRFGR